MSLPKAPLEPHLTPHLPDPLAQLTHVISSASWLSLLLLLLVLLGSVWLLLPARAQDGRPPKVPSYLPSLGSYFAMWGDFDAFVLRARKKYGDCFGVRSLGRTMYYITSPSMIQMIYKSPSEYALSPMQFEWMENIFGLSKAAAADASAVGQEMFPLIHKALAPSNVHDLAQAFADSAASSLRKLADKPRASPDSKSTPLLPLVYNTVFDAATHALFGPSFPPSSIHTPFETFDNSVPALAMGLPSSLDRPFTRAREQLLRTFELYLRSPQAEGASELIKGVVAVARAHEWSERDTAVWLLALLWPLQANSPYAVYWLLVLMLQTPDGLKPLVQEINAARQKWAAEHPEFSSQAGKAWTGEAVTKFATSAHLPLLTSTIQETLRFATGSFSVRAVQVESVKLGPYELKKGDHLVCSVRSLHLEEQIFERPDMFDPRRFMGRQYKQPSYLPFGGGISQCEGRHLALAQIRTVVVLLLCMVEIRLAESEQQKVGFREGQRGFGMIRPKGDLRVVVVPRA